MPKESSDKKDKVCAVICMYERERERETEREREIRGRGE